MKKKVMLASAMALALMISPLGGLNVSAEEGEAASVSEQSRTASSSEKVVLGTLTDLQLSGNLDKCTFTYPIGSNYGSMYTHIWLYRDDVLVQEYRTLGDNSSRGYVYIPQGSNGKYTTIEIPLYQYDMEASGSYYFKVRLESNWPNYLAVSETVTSETIEYTRPEQVLATTVGYWDTEKEGLFHYKSVEGAAGYEFCLYKQDENSGQWYPCTLMTPTDGLLTLPGHTAAFSNITSGSPRDAGGEDRTRNFSNDIFSNNYNTPTGKYCVTVKALSNNLSEIANGVEGDKSTVFEVGGSSASDSSQTDDSGQTDDSSQSDETSFVEDIIAAADSGSVVSVHGITTLTNAEMKLLLEQKITLEMEYTYDGVDYKIRIPAGSAMNNDIPYYGPLYLAQYYRVNSSGKTAGATGPSYTVQAGDTLSKIARANNMTVSDLAAKNPQIKNVNLIMPGQTIQIK